MEGCLRMGGPAGQRTVGMRMVIPSRSDACHGSSMVPRPGWNLVSPEPALGMHLD